MKFLRNFWPGIVWGIIIIILSAIPGNYFPEIQSFSDWLSLDKLVHLFLYFVFFYLIARGLIRQFESISVKPLLWGMFFAVFFGGAMEIMQHYVFVRRNGNIYDFLANTLGCALAYVLILYFERKKNNKSSLT